MRWSIIRLIWLRELRDQLRDRRTLFTILLLPLLLYPLINLLLLQFATQLLDQTSTIGLVSASPEDKDFPQRLPADKAQSVIPRLAWFSLTPTGMAMPLDRLAGAAALGGAGNLSLDYLLLFDNGEIPELYRQQGRERLPIFPGNIRFTYVFLTQDQANEALLSKKVDLVVSAADDFWERLIQGDRTAIDVRVRPGDNRSRRASEQFSILLGRWKTHLKEVRFRRLGLSPQIDDPFAIRNPLAPPSGEVLAATTLLDMLVRTFPFMLVMWSLAGALYPAVDLCAGEKERGTMETLLISPAGREEIVLGKFLTIWVFSAATAIMHLISMSVATVQLRAFLPQGAITLPALFWCTLLVLPLSASFSAVALAIGAYARSSKEGQYYMMPLFWITMPLVFLTLAPGVELNQFYSMVPVTGVALLMQRVMIARSLDQVPWFYFLPVFATVILYSWLALRWAVAQFQREEVLFRQTERLDLGLWVRRLFRDKEPLPTVGQSLCCFGVLFVLQWLSLNLGAHVPVVARSMTVLVAFVAAPPILMALILTTRPWQSLNLSLPPAGYLAAALLLLPLAEVAHYVLLRLPVLVTFLNERRLLVEESYGRFGDDLSSSALVYFLALSLLPALCEELAFRGLILTGLRRSLANWPAILLSSLLFAAYHMNVFALVPLFLLGIVLGWFAVQCNSLLPGVLLHAGCRLLILGGPLAVSGTSGFADLPSAGTLVLLLVLVLGSTALAIALLWRLNGTKTGVIGKSSATHATDTT
jgi:sodium transport system permease protein